VTSKSKGHVNRQGAWPASRLAASLAALLLIPVAAIIPSRPADAGVSSWFWSDGKTDEKKDPAKQENGQPATRLKPSIDADASAKSSGNTTNPDAAYEAFSKGKYLSALELAEKFAADGHPASHTLVGRLYSEGLGVPKDDKLAAQWFTRGAELGDVNAMFAIGLMLAEGRGVDRDYAAAAVMFENAARTGHPAANYNLGLLFMNGTGKPENKQRAAMHIDYAARKGVAAAQYDLAGLYLAGAGVENDALKAAEWLSKAASRGHAVAQYDYAVLLLQGRGLKRDEAKAIPYMKEAAKKGIAGAQNRLAYIYEEGIRVNKDLREMAKWRYLASQNGFEDPIMDNKLAKLDPALRSEAQAAAVEFRDKSLVAPLNISQ